jgi:hypothetical protein
MVSNYSDAGQVRWLSKTGIDLLRGNGRLAGTGVVEVDGVRHTAEHVVLATGSAPFVPPVPGLRELEGIWTNREVTGMKAVPRRLLVLGGGPVGRRDGAGRPSPRRRGCARRGRRARASPRACAARRSARRGLAPRWHRARPWRAGDQSHGATARTTSWSSTTARAARRSPARRHRPAPARRRDRPGDGRCRGQPATGSRSTRSLRAGERLWAVGDVNGIWQLTHVGKYQGEVVAANILGEPREANYEAVPRAVFTDPQAASVGAAEARFSATAPLSEVAKTATYTRAYAESNGFMTLLSDGERLTGAYALGPEAGEWLQQATLAIRARLSLEVLRDTIQPFPTFSEIYVAALKSLHGEISAARKATT